LVSISIFMVAVLPASPAAAAASAGASYDCDDYGHCVSGGAFSANSGLNAGGRVGAAVAGCKGTANGATLIVVNCSIGSASATMSYPGSVGVVPVVTDTSTLARVPVCWEVLAYFPNLSGGPYPVSTGGCAILAL
jgi:hypothetical protein